MAADSTLVSASFKSTPKVLDQTPLYQQSRRMGQQALGLVVGAMKKLDDKKEKQKLSKKVLKYAKNEFAYSNTINMWHNTMLNTLKEFKNRKNWTKITL